MHGTIPESKVDNASGDANAARYIHVVRRSYVALQCVELLVTVASAQQRCVGDTALPPSAGAVTLR
eukprot:5704947-Pyramimonas_sp.AAC.1